jgi:hypothetical protein
MRFTLYGIEAISAYNGWSMAIIGIVIVFTGLVTLSFVISKIHKVLYLLEIKKKLLKKYKKKRIQEKPKIIKTPESVLPMDINSLAYNYKPLVDQLGEPFKLSALINLSTKFDFPHPYISINYLRNAGILVSRGEGLFIWRHISKP